MRRTPGSFANPNSSALRTAGDPSLRAAFALAGAVAAGVLLSSWSTVKPPLDVALVLVLVAGLVHGLLGWVPGLRLPARLGPPSVVSYLLVLLLLLVVTPERLGAGRGPILWVRIAGGVLVAVVVHRVLAEPSPGRARLPRWQGFAVLALLPGVLGGAVLVADGLPASGARPGSSVQLASDAGTGSAATAGTVPADVAAALTAPDAGASTGAPPDAGAASPGGPGTTATSAASPSRTAPRTASTGRAAAAGPAPATPAAPTSTTAPPAPRAVKILISGDSTAGATGGGIRTWAQRNGRAQVDVVGTNGCALQQDGDVILRDGWKEPKNGNCPYLIDYTVQVATSSRPDLIILLIGSNQLSDWILPGQTVATHIGEPAFDQLYSGAATAALRRLASLGIPILFTTTPVPSWDPAIQTGNPDYPGTGPIKMNDAGRTRRLNDLTASAAAGVPLAVMTPYAARISNPDGTVSTAIRPDGVHLKPDAVPAIMDRGFEADLRASYQQVTHRVSSAARDGRNAWT